jgi:diacylglycerol kinase family enzyme
VRCTGVTRATGTRYPFTRLKVQSEYPFNLHADGTLIGTLPIDVVSIPKAIRVAMPAAAWVRASAPVQPVTVE